MRECEEVLRIKGIPEELIRTMRKSNEEEMEIIRGMELVRVRNSGKEMEIISEQKPKHKQKEKILKKKNKNK